ncbi:hypothetical protein PFFCH_03156 [Plasmodium falciparum FCH/4]|uniref:Uncharacterized protein n=1 Tax=Plasmodium falciparum FCH/4 TaxID=1036724 RepID=A0A024VMH3_PLAFA|nr:hypothetical protein PFFCH_03156 [Plasmodium falciparum FCH/4]
MQILEKKLFYIYIYILHI